MGLDVVATPDLLDLPIPCAAAIVRQLQSVLPFGLVCKVASMTALIRLAS
jgi:hypothetical protein